MARTTETFSISLPPEMMAELEKVRREEHRTRSELIREALRQYLASREVQKSASLDHPRIKTTYPHIATP